MIPTVWITDVEHLEHARFGGHATAIVSEYTEWHATATAVTLNGSVEIGETQSATEEMMTLLGGELKLSTDAIAQLAAAKERHSRIVTPVLRRGGSASTST